MFNVVFVACVLDVIVECCVNSVDVCVNVW